MLMVCGGRWGVLGPVGLLLGGGSVTHQNYRICASRRHELLLSGRPQLDQAMALDSDAVLVSEAVRLLDGGWDSALAAYDQRIRRAAPDD